MTFADFLLSRLVYNNLYKERGKQMSDAVKKAIQLYKTSKKKIGDFKKWSDKQVTMVRDKMRKIARKNRGKWTLEFYESLQLINKESLKRKLTQKTT